MDTHNLGTVITTQITAMLRMETDNEEDEYTHNKCTHNRMEKDNPEGKS